jgi:hypothetical protein
MVLQIEVGDEMGKMPEDTGEFLELYAMAQNARP